MISSMVQEEPTVKETVWGQNSSNMLSKGVLEKQIFSNSEEILQSCPRLRLAPTSLSELASLQNENNQSKVLMNIKGILKISSQDLSP